MNETNRRHAKDRRYGREMLVTKREMLMAQLLLRVCDEISITDRDQEFVRLYDAIKPIAEGILRDAP